MEEQNLGFVAGIDHSGFDKDAKHIQDSVEQVAKKVEQSGLSVDEFAKRMQGLLASFDRLTQAVDKNTSAQEKAMGAGKKAADAEKQGADKATDAIDKTGKATDELGRKLKKTGDDGAEGFGKLQKAAAGFFTLAAAKEFGQKIFEVRSDGDSEPPDLVRCPCWKQAAGRGTVQLNQGLRHTYTDADEGLGECGADNDVLQYPGRADHGQPEGAGRRFHG